MRPVLANSKVLKIPVLGKLPSEIEVEKYSRFENFEDTHRNARSLLIILKEVSKLPSEF